MDSDETLMFPTIGADLFHAGFISSIAVVDANRDRVVETQLPEATLGQFERWRWVNGQWVATIDYRGHAWYNPENTNDVFRAARFDDSPPAGWTLWELGQNRVVGEAERSRVKWVEVRKLRDRFLTETDWVTVKSLELGQPVPADWVEYRQALRNITAQSDPFQIIWPTRPDSAFGTLNQGVL